MTPPRSERGYALIAAVVSIALFSLMALAVINATIGPTRMVSAEADRARLSAAADAGVSIAIQRLMPKEPGQRWAPSKTPLRGTFANIRLDTLIEDERGKIALNLINKDQATRLFAEFGLQGSELDTAVDSFLDWRDQDFDPRPFGGEFEAYAEREIKPRNGDLRSLGEVALIRGIGPELAAKIAPVSTVNFGTGSFDPRHASPLARRIQGENSDDSVAVDFNAPIVAGQVRRAFRPPVTDSLIGRPLTIEVTAHDDLGARAKRRVIIELTGAPDRPYIIRARE